MSKMSGDESEVVFDQPEKKAGAMEPDGPVPNRRKEEGWWEATEPLPWGPTKNNEIRPAGRYRFGCHYRWIGGGCRTAGQ